MIRISNHGSERIVDTLAIEAPLTMELTHKGTTYPLGITMRTPGDDIDLTVGLLYSEGIIEEYKYIENIDFLLFDYKPKSNELPGGNSKSFDWSLLKEVTIKLPWFISGGINESNIKNIQKTINPHGIDLSSGVEQSLGIKSKKKINNLFRLFYDN